MPFCCCFVDYSMFEGSAESLAGASGFANAFFKNDLPALNTSLRPLTASALMTFVFSSTAGASSTGATSAVASVAAT